MSKPFDIERAKREFIYIRPCRCRTCILFRAAIAEVERLTAQRSDWLTRANERYTALREENRKLREALRGDPAKARGPLPKRTDAMLDGPVKKVSVVFGGP